MSGELLKFFTIAKKNCANYSSTGPEGKVDYCYPGPGTCALKEDRFCPYFDKAVIGYKPFREAGLQQQWQELWQGAPKKIVNRLCGGCREEFRPTSPRQKYCVSCQGKSRRERTRLRVRKHRMEPKNQEVQV